MESATPPHLFRFGEFELDTASEELRCRGRRLKLQPQPFKLLVLLVRRANAVVSRDEIRRELWGEGTFVDFDQAVNFAIKQVRDALRDDAERPLFVQTVPKRGYRFMAAVDPGDKVAPEPRRSADGTTVRLQKALWANIAEMRLAEARRRRLWRIGALALLVLIAGLAVLFVFDWVRLQI
jgi:DNA-binding winged helix-turn-helix (wHTH) protein